MHGHASLRSTANEELFSEDLEFSQDKFCMPDPRQQDHRLNKDELVTYRYSVVLVEEQSFKFICSHQMVITRLACQKRRANRGKPDS